MENKLKQALIDASNWEQHLTEQERTTITVETAKALVIDRIFKKYQEQYLGKNDSEKKKYIIGEYQLKGIYEALRITSNIHNSHLGKTCHDRQVRQALTNAKNALDGDYELYASYITGKNY